MVYFANEYWHAMDKDKVEQITISPRDMGISQGIGDPWANLQTSIKAGATHVELGFMGMGKGSIGSPTGITPETIGREKREDIRQLAKLNKVTLSTHASANAMGFAGLSENRFSEQAAQRNVTEVKRAIDFAADTAEGGPVVIHTGEFPRSVSEAEKREGKPLFRAYEGEEKKGPIYLVNNETGEIIGGISKEMKIPEPETKDGNFVFDDKGRMKFKNEKEGGYNFEQFTKEHKQQIEQKGIPAEEYFYQEIIDKKRKQAEAETGRWRENMEQAMKKKENISDAQKELYKKSKENEKMASHEAQMMIHKMDMIPKEGTQEFEQFKHDPIKYLDRVKDKLQQDIDYTKSGVEGHAKELKDLENQRDKIKTAQNYAAEKTAQNIAHLGMYAYEVEKKKKLKNPLFVAPENIFAEQYGSHPQELRKIVVDSRKEMVKQLRKNMSASEAEKVAAQHIKATFDIGHANTWKKYFQGSDEDFKKWLVKEAKQLQKEGIIGNVHLADNFGYEDEHLTPGQGNAPIEEFLKEIKAEGYEGKMVVEPGSQTEQEGGIFTALTGAWGHLAHSPIYRTSGGFAQSWTDVSGGYLGNTWTPKHVSGTYLPSKEGWGWYSETPIE